MTKTQTEEVVVKRDHKSTMFKMTCHSSSIPGKDDGHRAGGKQND